MGECEIKINYLSIIVYNFKKIKYIIKRVIKSKGRTSRVVQNLALSSILKIISIIISFTMVPITLSYLSKARYGLWAALSSVLLWFFTFDIGIGNGLRNKFIELKAKGESNEIRNYVSTSYFLFSSIAIILIIFFLLGQNFVDWTKLLKVPKNLGNELEKTVLIVFIIMSLNFVAKLIKTILQADLKNGISDGLGVISRLITLAGIIILMNTTKPSLLNFALLYTCSNLMVTVVASIILFNTIYKSYAPKIEYIKFNLWKPLVSVGIKFFILQISAIILFQTTSFILCNLIGPESVTDYNITKRYFSFTLLVFTMLSQPLWAGYGDAYHKNDNEWILRTFVRLKKLFLLLCIIMIFALLSQKFIFQLWLNGRVEVNYTLSALFVIYYALQMWSSIFNPFINATGKLKLGLRVVMVTVPLFIPLSVYLVKYLNFGSPGILIALIILQGIPAAVLYPIRSRKILNNEPGIWNE